MWSEAAHAKEPYPAIGKKRTEAKAQVEVEVSVRTTCHLLRDMMTLIQAEGISVELLMRGLWSSELWTCLLVSDEVLLGLVFIDSLCPQRTLLQAIHIFLILPEIMPRLWATLTSKLVVLARMRGANLHEVPVSLLWGLRVYKRDLQYICLKRPLGFLHDGIYPTFLSHPPPTLYMSGEFLESISSDQSKHLATICH